nr:hypothetical protein [uncultured Holophaga sp.]
MTINPLESPVEPSEQESSTPVKKSLVLVQKRRPVESDGTREKLCATCGKPFKVTPEQKFYLCPGCYRKAHPVHKSPRKSNSQILIQIKCVSCGSTEFLDFMPPDPSKALCRICYTQQCQREPRPRIPHKRSR